MSDEPLKRRVDYHDHEIRDLHRRVTSLEDGVPTKRQVRQAHDTAEDALGVARATERRVDKLELAQALARVRWWWPFVLLVALGAAAWVVKGEPDGKRREAARDRDSDGADSIGFGVPPPP